MKEVTAWIYLVSINRSCYSAVYNGGHAKTVFLHAAISAAAHQTCEMLMNVNFRICRDERSELYSGISLRSLIEAPLITREALPETYFLLVTMGDDAQAQPFLQFQGSR